MSHPLDVKAGDARAPMTPGQIAQQLRDCALMHPAFAFSWDYHRAADTIDDLLRTIAIQNAMLEAFMAA